MFKMRLCVVISLAFAALAAPIGAAASATTSIQNIMPSQGPITGGTQVTLAGSGFTGTTLTLDGATITPSAASDTQIVFQTPAHDNGIVTLKLSGNGPTAYAEFLYVPPSLQDLPPGYITTVAGIGLFTGLYRPATQAELHLSGSPAFDRQGNLYIPEPGNNRIIRVRPDGILEPFAGTGIPDYQSTSGIGDGGPATEASLTFPRGVTTDATGNVYITEAKSRIRRVDAQTGIITTIAGDGTRGFSGDGGPAVQAQLNDASHITGDGNGTLYFIDVDDASSVARIRKITPDGIISTVAGIGPPGFSGDGGPATQAQFNLIWADQGSLALDSQGNLFIADPGNGRIRRIDGRSGIITTVYGPASLKGFGGVAADQSGNIFFSSDSPIIKMDLSGQIITTYGSANPSGSSQDDGTPIQNASIASWGLTIDPLGNIVYVETNRVRRLNLATGLLETVAGMGSGIIGENGPAIAAALSAATDLAFLPSGELLIGDTGHVLIRKLEGNGNISTFAKGRTGGSSFDSSTAIEPDRIGNVFITDMWNVYRIDSTGTVGLFVGPQGEYGYTGDGGPATQALLCEPFDVAIDRAGNFFIADTNNNRIRRVDAQTGIITTVAGSGPVNGFERFEADGSFSGDDAPATQATLNTPLGVAVDAQGNLFIADSGNRRIRKVDTNGIITTFAANTGPGVNKLAFDGAGNLYTVSGEGLVRYDPTGKNTQLTVRGQPGFSGDGGPALQAKTRTQGQAVGVAIDSEGNVFFVDPGNARVRAVRYGAVMAQSGSTVTASGGSAQMTPTGTTFPNALQITLKSPAGTPENGIRVDFATPASGASCTFAAGSTTFSTLTDIDGHASATCTANVQFGAYNVTATPLALNQSVSFLLTNALPPGDIDGNGSVDLADAILALQVLSGITPAGMVYKEVDVNGDGKIGMAEAIYILQNLVGMRQP
jgi:sugar lactone lactonase YvrE